MQAWEKAVQFEVTNYDKIFKTKERFLLQQQQQQQIGLLCVYV